MREYGSDEITPHQAVLGLMARGALSVGALRKRLEKEFPNANFARNTASTAPKRLARKGKLKLIQQGDDPSEDVYAATRAGLDDFEEWLYSVPVLPSLRDTVLAKLALVPPHGVGRLIEIIKVVEKAARHQYGVDHGKMKTVSLGAEGNPALELERLRHKFTATRWYQEVQRLVLLRKDLEQFRKKHQAWLESHET